MAVSLGTAYIKIAPDLTGVQNKISGTLNREISKAGAEAGKGFGANFAKLAEDPLVKFGDKVLKGTLVAGAVTAGVMIAKNIGGAIDRIDTLVAFPRTLEALGVASVDASKATKTLSDRLKGLPTGLDEGARGIQSMVVAGLGIDKATDAYLAFNNAVLAGSVDTIRAEAGFDMLNKAINTGKITAQQWTSITTAMPTAMQALQKETGLTSQELLELYRNNPQALTDALIRLDQEGGGGLASLQEQAKLATGGIGTAFDNLDNAIKRGLESMVIALGDGSLEEGQRKISEAITKIGTAFEGALKGTGEFFKFIIDNKDIFGPIAVAVATFAGALGLLAGIIKIASAVQAIWNGVLLANPIILIVTLILALVAGLIYFFTQTKLGQEIWQNLTNFLKDALTNISNFFKSAWDGIKMIWDGVVLYFRLVWFGIQLVFNAAGSWFSNIFTGAWNGIKNAFSGVTGFFRGLWNSIVSIFGSIGTAVGNAIGGSVKTAINAVIRGAVNIINGFINAINTVINVINKLPGVSIGKVGKLEVPALASGGITTGPTLAMIGEGKEQEAVLPLSYLDKMISGDGKGTTVNQTNNVYTEIDMNVVNRQLTWELNRS